jgi:protein-disulfide isomerase
MTIVFCKKARILLRLGLFLVCIPGLAADETTAPVAPKVPVSEPRPVATFNGATITEDDLRAAALADLDKLNLQFQQIRASLARTEQQILETNLIHLLADKLFEAEAANRGLGKEAYLEQELKGKIKEPSQQEIKAYYEANRKSFQKPFDTQISEKIRQYLKAENRARATGELADRLKANYKVQILLPPLRVHVKTEGSPSRGLKDAPVTIVEFSDFQSPLASQLNKTLQEVMAKYGDKVRLVYRQFPLSPIHPFAEKASEASLCAADQNQFWELHDSMFETQNELKSKDLEAKAAKLKLDPNAFNTCLSSGKYAQRVQHDQREGYALGVMDSPAFFINGRYLSGALAMSDLSKMVNEEINLSSRRKAGALAEAHGNVTAPSPKNP